MPIRFRGADGSLLYCTNMLLFYFFRVAGSYVIKQITDIYYHNFNRELHHKKMTGIEVLWLYMSVSFIDIPFAMPSHISKIETPDLRE